MPTSPASRVPPRKARTQTPRFVTPVHFRPPGSDDPDSEPIPPTARKAAPAAMKAAEPAPAEPDQIDADDTATAQPEVDDTEEPANPEGPPTDVNGIRVVREELVSALKNAPFKYSRLHLEDGTSCWTCRDCWLTFDTRGEVMQHRNRRHGNRYGQRKPKVTVSTEQGMFDLAIEPRADGEAVPDSTLDWTFREFLAAMPSITAYGNLIEDLERQRDAAVAQLRTATASVSASDQHKIDAFESHRREIVELRTWKKNVIRKFQALGFKLEDSEE